ncbi:MAG: pyridoxamine 5'-phosphate oxidase, partial [Myxococcota bacterium]
MARPQPNYFNDLNLTLTKALDQLARGVHDRHSQFRTPTLVTVSPEGHPAARTVVLRHFDRNTRTLTLHTDRRS